MCHTQTSCYKLFLALFIIYAATEMTFAVARAQHQSRGSSRSLFSSADTQIEEVSASDRRAGVQCQKMACWQNIF